MNLCPACGQVIQDPTVALRITEAELRALSAWWWAKTTRGAARVLGLAEQTVKNQLADARRRNRCTKTFDLAQMFTAQLLTLEELMQHNRRRQAA